MEGLTSYMLKMNLQAFVIRETTCCCFAYNNLGHNILELYNILAQIQFTTSKTKREI